MLEFDLLWVVGCRPALLDVVGPPFVGDGEPPAIRWSRALSAIVLERDG